MDGDVDMKSEISGDNDDQKLQNTNFLQLPYLIGQREIGHKFHLSTTNCLEKWGEESFVKRHHVHMSCHIPATAKTTYLLAFSPDGTKVASSHGDHNIYVCEVKTGQCICTLRGHPRSPWCVAFHPSSNEIMASGCLGGEVRVWDLKGGSEMWTPNKKCITDKKSVIASLAFHPSEQLLVIATENELYFWDWFRSEPFAKISTATKLEKIKYVEFDPLGYKLITGIAITRPEKPQTDTHLVQDEVFLSTNDENADASSNTFSDSFQNSVESDPIARSSRSLRAVSSATNRLYRILDRVIMRRRNPSLFTVEESAQDNEVPSNLFFRQQVALNRARNFAQTLRERIGDNEPGSGTATDPSSLTDFPVQGPPNTRSISSRRHYLMPRSSSSQVEDDFPPMQRVMSEDSASSSSLDSSSSVTSGVSGASHERNTRLSLLWTSRLNRGAGGNESDNSVSGRGYDLEERRGEGSVMRAGPVSESRPDTFRDDLAMTHSYPLGGSRSVRERRASATSRRSDGIPIGRSNRRPGSSIISDDQSDRRHDEEESERNRLPLPARSAAGQGGRWMYYRGKAFSDNQSNRPQRSGKNALTPMRVGRLMLTRNRDPNSRTTDDSLAVAGPSGVSQSNGASGSSTANTTFPTDGPTTTRFPNPSRRTRSRDSLVDPQYGVRLLSRHIEHMQSICRSLSIPRAHLELSHLQQIRTMLYDVQHQIRSLRALVNQTTSDDLTGLDESLNSASVEPDPLATAELLGSQGGVTDQVEVEVNIGSDDVDQQYSYMPLNEENTSQLNSEEMLPSGSDLNLIPLGSSTPSVPQSSSANDSGGPSAPSTSGSARSRAFEFSRSRLRSRRLSRIRETWSGLARRNPQFRRSFRAKMHSSGSLSDGLRHTRWRNLREAKRDQRRNRLYNRRVERTDLSAPSTASNNEAAGNSSQPPKDSGEVRSRHSGDWQRRLRSVLALERQRRSVSTGPASISVRFPERNSNNPGVPRTEQGTQARPARLGAGSRGNQNNGSAQSATLSNGRYSDEDSVDGRPERLSRAGPPTTSLASRIDAMLAQQRDARNRNAPSASNGLPTGSDPTNPGLMEDEHSANSPRDDLYVFLLDSSAESSNPLSNDPVDPPNDDSALSLRPMYERLQNLRREIMINHRNRYNRRRTASLATGRDLAGATLSAISNPEQDNQGLPVQRDRTESFRQMLQIMAERLTQMMEYSFPSEDDDSSHRRSQSARQISALRHYNLRPRQGDSTSRDPVSSEFPQRERENDFSNNGAVGPPSTLNRHMQNLRVLVQLALHLIYQLLNFICNQNLSYEERPISRLPNPFREENNQSQRFPATESGTSTAQEPLPSTFEMDIEPGLHNLTTLLETVQMASEELRNDALNTSNPPSGSSELRDRHYGVLLRDEPPTRDVETNNNREPESQTPQEESGSGSTVRRRLTDFLIRTGSGPYRLGSISASSNTNTISSSYIQRPQPTTPTATHDDFSSQFPAPQSSVSDASRRRLFFQSPEPESFESQDEVNSHLRTFGGIPLRLLGRQNAVDRRSPELDEAAGGPSIEPEDSGNSRFEARRGFDRSFFLQSSQRHHPFRIWNTPGHGHSSSNLFSPSGSSEPQAERDPEHSQYFSNVNWSTQYFSHYVAASRNIGGSLFDPYPQGLYNSNYSFYRIQAWDYRNFEIPDISDRCSNVVVWKCRIHFDASVSISVDGTLLAAVLPDTKSVTRIGVYSLETKTLGQLMYTSSIGFNIVCVSLSPTMNHLVVGISSHRLGGNHNERQVIGRIYKLWDLPNTAKVNQPGILKFCRAIELSSEFRQSSLNCIRWVPVPGQGLVYGTNRGHLTVIR